MTVLPNSGRSLFTLSAPFLLGLKKEMRFQSAIIISFLDKSILPRAESSGASYDNHWYFLVLLLSFLVWARSAT